MTNEQNGITRRRALQLLGGTGMLGLAGCSSVTETLPGDRSGFPGNSRRVPQKEPPSGPADTTVELHAGTPGQEPPSGVSPETWLYEESFPGPVIQATEGEVVAVILTNGLPEGTSVHWHGVPVANSMDGVPHLTQNPVQSASSFDYRFRAEPPGTYFYHSHAGLQLDRGLSGPLIIEETDPHIDYDDEYVIVLDDHLTQAPRAPKVDDQGFDDDDSSDSSGGMGGGGMGDGGMHDGGPMGGMMNIYRPSYRGMVMNGRLAENAPTFEVREGERVRLRFINASSTTMFRVRPAGHQFQITHTDGRPVEPVSVDSFTFGPGERYDAILPADNPGSWELLAAPVRGSEPRARGVIQYAGEDIQRPTRPETWGRGLTYNDLRAIRSLEGIDGPPDRTFNLTLSPGNEGYSWAIGGQVFPDADPLQIQKGDHVRINMQNRSPVRHPMHLHGHFFQVGDAIKDTVVVPGRMGQATIDFTADNPGNWLFHCHNLYHLEAGMARIVQYV